MIDMADLVQRKDLSYVKFTNVPYTGKARGKCPFVDCRGGMAYGEFKKGVRHGDWISYFDSGDVYEQGVWRNGKQEGDWLEYRHSGQLQFEWHHENNDLIGYTSYHKNGNVQTVEKYGVHRNKYWSNKRLERKTLYKDGEEKGIIACNKDGTVDQARTTITELDVTSICRKSVYK